MCGRYVSATPAAVLAEEFKIDEVKAPDLGEKYNVAPSEDVYAVATSKGTRKLGTFHWGLVPHWAKDPKIGNRMINARADSLTEKPSFKRTFAKRRCIIPADGFYEWQDRGKGRRKQPFYIRRKDGKPMGLAGLWEVWHDPDKDSEAEEPLRSCTIITTEPNDLLGRIHDRMPVVLPEEAYDFWLDPDNDDLDKLSALLVPYPSDRLEAFPVSTEVSNVKNDGAHLIEPLEGHEPES